MVSPTSARVPLEGDNTDTTGFVAGCAWLHPINMSANKAANNEFRRYNFANYIHQPL
jgi:hypothetical protein